MSGCQNCGGTGWQPATSGVFPCPCKKKAATVNGKEIQARVQAALADQGTSQGGKFDRGELRVMELLRRAFGQSNAIAIKQMLDPADGLDQRAIKGIVSRLRAIHRLPIGSSRIARPAPGPDDRPRFRLQHFGYYWITSRQELLDTVGPYLRQAKTELEVVSALMGGQGGYARAERELEGQMRLDYPGQG